MIDKKFIKGAIVFFVPVSIISTAVAIPVISAHLKEVSEEESKTSIQAIENANIEIDKAVEAKTKPTLKGWRVKDKTASDLVERDLIAPYAFGRLMFKVTRVVKSETVTDGTTATVTIQVSSTVPRTKTNQYNVDISGLLSEEDKKTIIAKAADEEIKQAIARAAYPTFTDWALQHSTAEDLNPSDFNPPEPTGTLTFTVANVAKSEKTPDGTTVKVTIHVVSSVEGSTAKDYEVEFTGLIALIDKVDKEITDAIRHKPAPTLNDGAADKTAAELTPNDFTLPQVGNRLRLKILEISKSKIITDGSVASLKIEVSSSIPGAKTGFYFVEVKGLTYELNRLKVANTEIQTEVAAATAPTIATGSESKTAKDVGPDDFVLPDRTDSLIVKIFDVVKSTATPDGTTATLTIRVSSPIAGATSGEYHVEVGGFAPETTTP